jgi:hypothetical protein
MRASLVAPFAAAEHAVMADAGLKVAALQVRATDRKSNHKA